MQQLLSKEPNNISKQTLYDMLAQNLLNQLGSNARPIPTASSMMTNLGDQD